LRNGGRLSTPQTSSPSNLDPAKHTAARSPTRGSDFPDPPPEAR
jgi:hypothetical protein